MMENIKEMAWRHSKHPADPSDIEGDVWVFTEKELEDFCNELTKSMRMTIDTAYWQLEVADRIAALKSLSVYAMPRNINEQKNVNSNKPHVQ